MRKRNAEQQAEKGAEATPTDADRDADAADAATGADRDAAAADAAMGADRDIEADAAGTDGAGGAADGAGFAAEDRGARTEPGASGGETGDHADIGALQQACRTLEQKVQAVEAALQAERDHALRLQADFDNFRRRTRQEQEDGAFRALDAFLKELLPVLDNLDRAVDAAQAAGERSGPALLQGVEMVRNQLVALLATRDVEAMATVGRPFDPNMHEAVQRVDEDGYARDTVTEEWQKGYVRAGRVLRPAMVKVAVGSGEAEGDATGGASG